MLRPRFDPHFQPEQVAFLTDCSYGVVPVTGQGACRQFLLVLSRKGHWAFPKGHADPGETPREAALRELREETGIARVALHPARTFEEQYDFVSKSGQAVRKTVIYHLGFVRQKPSVIIQAAEIADYRWCNAHQASELITFDECRALFADVCAFLRQYES